MNTTIVSAFLSNVNSYRDVEKYIECGKRLLEIDNIYKVIFIEKTIYDTYFLENSFENIKFVFMERSDIYLYEQIDNITKFSVESTNPHKDTIDYMFVQCNKTEWIRHAIELNPFNTDHFIWVDFGIYHMINNDNFNDSIYKMTQQNYQNVRIATSWDFNAYYHNNYYTQVMWYFSGSVFGGDKNKLLLFADLMKKYCLDIIDKQKTLMWEVNIWYLIYNDNKDLFDRYYGTHNNTIIDNY
jgi:hypothetical protein